MTKIAIGSDHAGFELKEVIITYLKEKKVDQNAFKIIKSRNINGKNAKCILCISFV